MNIPVQTVQQEQDQKKEITLKKKFQHKRKTFESSYSNKSSEEETSSSPEEGETVTVDAKEGTFEHGGYKFIIVDLPGT